MQYSGADDFPAYRSRFDRSPRSSVRRIYDLKTIDFANTPSGARRSASWSRTPSSRLGSGHGSSGYGNTYGSGYTTGYGSGYGGYNSGYNNGYDSGGASSQYNFGNHIHPSASSRSLGPQSHRRSWRRPFGSLLAEAEADLSTMSHARSRLFKMADDALSVLNAIREGFNTPFEPRSRQKWGLDDLFGTTADDDVPPPRSYRSPIVMEDCIKRIRPRWSTLSDDSDAAELFSGDSCVNTLRRSPMPSTAEVLARLETPTDFPPFRYADDYLFGRTDPTRSYHRSADKPKDLDGLRNARRQYFENQQQNEETIEKNIPIIVDEQRPMEVPTPTVRIDAPAPTVTPASVKIPVEVESESRFTPIPVPTLTSTQPKDDAKRSGQDDRFTSSMDYSSVSSIEVTNEKCSKLEEENSRLRDLVHNVTEINKRWEKFSSEREAYIAELKATIKNQQEQLNQCLELLRLAKAGQSEDSQQTSTFQQSASYEQLKERLREIIEPKTTEEELTQLQSEVARLQKRLEETKKEHSDLVGAFQQVKSQNVGTEESCETTILRDEYHTTRSLSKESNSEATETAENTNRMFPTISKNSSTHTVTQEDHRSTVYSPISPLREGDDNISTCSRVSEAYSETKFSDRQNAPEREKDLFKYAFDCANLRNCQEDVYGKRHSSPADGLSPTPTPTPGATRYVPLELSCSASSIASAVPVVSIPPSSRESSAERDISICSDATIDCSPPSPVPVTVGYDNNGLATVTTFRTVPIVREASPDRKSDDSGDSVKSVIETKPEPPRRPQSFVEEEETCSLVSPRGVLARTTSTHGSSVDEDGNGRSWTSDVYSQRLSADTVSCPKCGNTYPPSKYLQLMIHLDNCRTASGSPGVTLQELALSAMNHIMNS